MNDNLIISPRTKVLQLIEAYPQLEDILISFVSAFKKLKNPVLRKTVAKVATLQQAAAIGNVKIEDLINLLRKEVGQDMCEEASGSVYNTKKPDWFNENLVKKDLDAREMLGRGEHPVAQVMADLNLLENNSIFKLTAPFLPAPLIDKAISINIEHWVDKKSDELYNIYFCKKVL